MSFEHFYSSLLSPILRTSQPWGRRRGTMNVLDSSIANELNNNNIAAGPAAPQWISLDQVSSRAIVAVYIYRFSEVYLFRC